jgi:ubiquitin carboxyl-terminal hydrolase 2/21
LRFRKQALLYTVPRYLILHLSRFLKGYYNSEKNNREVSFEEYITVDEGSTARKVEYKLMGIIHHLGTLNRGHYFAEVKIKDEWYEMDDERVIPARISRYSNYSKSAYMLIYQRSN